MDLQRNLVFMTLLFLSIAIYQTWLADNNNIIENNVNYHIDKKNTNKSKPIGKIITASTNVISIKINTTGGNIEEALLRNYSDKLNSSVPFHLLETNNDFTYQAQSGLAGKDGPDNPINNKPIFLSKKTNYVLKKEDNSLYIPLQYIDINGVIYNKTFLLKRDDFTIDIEYKINNLSSKKIELILFGQFKQNFKHQEKLSNNISNDYRSIAYSTNYDKYKKYNFDSIINKNLNIATNNGWIAVLQQYFTTAWIPEGNNVFYTKNINNKYALIGFKSYPIIINPYNNFVIKTRLWLGPDIQDKMTKVAPYLDLTVDYGWLWFISQPLFKLLKFIHDNYINNWGYSIIIITLLLKIVMYPLTKAQYISMIKMRMLQPKIIAIKNKIGNDKRRYSQELINLYKKEKVNPLGGFLILFIQMPIFLALYYVLSESIELRHAKFVFWINDLSAKDPYYVLPIIMGITMFIIQKISPNNTTNNDENSINNKITLLIPILFTVFFLWFPSGLVLYYIISNVMTILQQKLIYLKLKNNN